jgi:endo-1,4-beta-xylanase
VKDRWNFPKKEQLTRVEKLPDPLIGLDGKRISSPDEWPEQREYLKAMMEHYLYGHAPQGLFHTKGTLLSSRMILEGRAVREIIRIDCGPDRQISFEMKVSRPNRPGRFPVFIWNHPDMPIGAPGSTEERLMDCPAEAECIARGYAVAAYRKDQLTPLNIGANARLGVSNGQCHKFYPDYDWRAIAMWGWGGSRVLDFLDAADWADPGKYIATGGSHCGKTAIYQTIFDERFAICAAICSGNSGAGNYRYLGGRMGRGIGYVETIGDITDKNGLWWWLSDNLAEFGKRDNQYDIGDEAYLPFDTHFLRALVAPRAFISIDQLDDVWCGAFGTQLSWHASQPVFKFLGAEGKNALFFREGTHSVGKLDFLAALDFADRIFYGIKRPHSYTDKIVHLYYPEWVTKELRGIEPEKIDFKQFFDYEYDD